MTDINTYHKEYYSKNPDRFKDTRIKYYENNKEAYAERSRKWYADPKNKIKVRERKFKVDFWQMVRDQDNKCAICGTEFTDYSQVHIDHNHKTGLVRGLLCKQHNRGLGFFNDNWELLEKAAQYLKEKEGYINGKA